MKLRLFLFAVLCAAAADATFLTARLASVQQRVETFVTAKIDWVETEYARAKQHATELSEKIEKSANSFTDRITDDVTKIVKKAAEDIDRLVNKAGDIDVSDCKKFIDHLHDTENTLISVTTGCVADKKETGRAYIKKIDVEATAVLEKLSAVKEEARQCGENRVGLTDLLRAIRCTKRAGLKAKLFVAKSLPTLTVNIGKITYLLAALQPSLAYCTSTHGLSAFYRESSRVVRETETCIRQKIKEAHHTTETAVVDPTEAVPTTPLTTEDVEPTEDPSCLAPSEPAITEEVDPTEAAPTEPAITEKVDPTEPAPTDPAITEKVDPTEAAPTEPAITEEIDPTEAVTTEPAITEKVDPTEPAPTDPAITEEIDPTEAVPTEPAITEKIDSTEAVPTEPAITEKVDPTEPAPTEPSITEKVDPTEAAPTEPSITEKVDPTEAALTEPSIDEQREVTPTEPSRLTRFFTQLLTWVFTPPAATAGETATVTSEKVV